MTVTTTFMDGVIFPEHVSRGSAGGPDWPADIVALSSGKEERNTRFSRPRRSYDVSYGIRTPAEAHAVLSLYYAAMGRMRGFRYLDWSDYRSCEPSTKPAADDQSLGTGDGSTTVFQLKKRYTYSSITFDRTITRPFGTILVAIDGTATTDFTIDKTTGKITFDSAPADDAVLTWGGQFHVPVRFDSALDQVDLQGPYENIPSILLKELLE